MITFGRGGRQAVSSAMANPSLPLRSNPFISNGRHVLGRLPTTSFITAGKRANSSNNNGMYNFPRTPGGEPSHTQGIPYQQQQQPHMPPHGHQQPAYTHQPPAMSPPIPPYGQPNSNPSGVVFPPQDKFPAVWLIITAFTLVNLVTSVLTFTKQELHIEELVRTSISPKLSGSQRVVESLQHLRRWLSEDNDTAVLGTLPDLAPSMIQHGVLVAVQNGIASADTEIRNAALEVLFELIHRKFIIDLIVKQGKIKSDESNSEDAKKSRAMSAAGLAVLNNLTVLLINTIKDAPDDPALGLMVAAEAKIIGRGLSIRSVTARDAGRKLAECMEPLAQELHVTHMDQTPQAQIDVSTDVASLCCALAQDPANAALVANALPSLTRLLSVDTWAAAFEGFDDMDLGDVQSRFLLLRPGVEMRAGISARKLLVVRLTDALDQKKKNWWTNTTSPLQVPGAEKMNKDAFAMLVEHRREISGGEGKAGSWQLVKARFLDHNVEKLVEASEVFRKTFEVMVFGFLWGKIRTLSALRHVHEPPMPPTTHSFGSAPPQPYAGAAPIPTYHNNPQVQQQVQQHLIQQQPHLQQQQPQAFQPQPHPHSQQPHTSPVAQRVAAAYVGKNWKGALSTRHGVLASIGSLLVYTMLETETFMDGRLWVPNSQVQVAITSAYLSLRQVALLGILRAMPYSLFVPVVTGTKTNKMKFEYDSMVDEW